MLTWPLLFFGVVFALKGLQINNYVAKVVHRHPQNTAFFVTLVGNIVCLIINILFSSAVTRSAQEWIAQQRTEVTVYHVLLLTGLRTQTWPWTLKDLKEVFALKRWLQLVLLGVCIGTFTFVPSSTTSLLTPIPFNRTVALKGTEVDFSSTDTDCLAWLNKKYISINCDWEVS